MSPATSAPARPLHSPVRVLGIDPGSRLCGWGVIDVEGVQTRPVDNGVLVLDEAASLALRLEKLFALLTAVVAEHRPMTSAIEGVFQHRNARSALILGHARGVALVVLARAGLPVAEYTPQQIKKAATGTGRAEKSQIQQVVARRLGLPEPPQTDAADALAVALCHAQNLAFPAAISLPRQPSRREGRRQNDAALRALVAAQGHAPPPKPRTRPAGALT